MVAMFAKHVNRYAQYAVLIICASLKIKSSDMDLKKRKRIIQKYRIVFITQHL